MKTAQRLGLSNPSGELPGRFPQKKQVISRIIRFAHRMKEVPKEI